MNAISEIVPDVLDFVVRWEGDKATFAKAFVQAQKAMEAVKKGRTNDHFKSKYAELSDVTDAALPALNEAGIGLMQFPGAAAGEAIVITTLMHESGASVTSGLRLRPVKADPQGFGSAFTYGRRYSLLAMTGLAPEDDDGNAASGPREEPQRRQQREIVPPVGNRREEPAAVSVARVAISVCNDPRALAKWWGQNEALFKQITDPEYDAILEIYEARMAEVSKPAPAPTTRAEQSGLDISADEIPY